MIEKELSKKSQDVFSHYFDIQTEVKSKCRQGRIDLILTCKQSGAVFGVELKSTERKRGDEIGKIFEQCIRYSKYLFFIDGEWKRIPIFLCPALSVRVFVFAEGVVVDDEGNYCYYDRHKPYHKHHSFNGFLGNWRIGEVRTFDKDEITDKRVPQYFSLITNNKIIWTSRKNWKTKEPIGLHGQNYNYLINKIKEL